MSNTTPNVNGSAHTRSTSTPRLRCSTSSATISVCKVPILDAALANVAYAQ